MAIKEASLEPLILELPFVENAREGEQLIKTFIEKHPNIDPVFFATNYLAQRGLLVIKENFPARLNEWGIMNFDDNEFFRIHTPSISAVAQPLDEIGKKLMEIMLELLKKEGKTKAQQVVLNTSFKIRDSSMSKSGKGVNP